jgi:hypothetical protein
LFSVCLTIDQLPNGRHLQPLNNLNRKRRTKISTHINSNMRTQDRPILYRSRQVLGVLTSVVSSLSIQALSVSLMPSLKPRQLPQKKVFTPKELHHTAATIHGLVASGPIESLVLVLGRRRLSVEMLSATTTILIGMSVEAIERHLEGILMAEIDPSHLCLELEVHQEHFRPPGLVLVAVAIPFVKDHPLEGSSPIMITWNLSRSSLILWV